MRALTMGNKEYAMTAALKTAVVGGLALALSGCISLTPEPPASLLTLTATTQSDSAPAASAASAIKIMEPETPARLNVPRVPVQIDDTEVAYLKDAIWVEKPARLFRSLVSEVVRTRTGRFVVDGDDQGFIAPMQLRGSLREFGYDARTSSVVVKYDAVKIAADGAVESRRFSTSVGGVLPEAAAVGTALNTASNQLAVEIADWIGSA